MRRKERKKEKALKLKVSLLKNEEKKIYAHGPYASPIKHVYCERKKICKP